MRAVIGAICLALMGGAASAATPAEEAQATVHAFIDAFDKGDIKAAEATHEPDVAIIDEMAPHEWHGPGAFMAWVGALMKSSAAAGQTNEAVVLGRTIRAESDGATAYVVMEGAFNYKQGGKAVSEPSRMVFALRKEASGWKISAWAWAGDPPP
ncbi:MAG TPA: nuclear transport factor 2 family protein [Caulobacteraceae bacterium]|jgi:ketosteroid isomerase-like protein|nr:nuclear transport factor 2 family protein [Caulobacteraceae bacterium]